MYKVSYNIILYAGLFWTLHFFAGRDSNTSDKGSSQYLIAHLNLDAQQHGPDSLVHQIATSHAELRSRCSIFLV